MTRKKIVLVLFLMVLGLIVFEPAKSHAGIIDSGSCGSSVFWYLDEDGTMTISGNGDMDSYEKSNKTPWYEMRTDIKSLIIDEGVTAVGKNAFNGCENIESMVIPVTTKIGRYAFSSGSSNAGMKKLVKVTITGTGDMFDYSQSTKVNNVNVEWNYCWDTPWRQADMAGHNLEVVISNGITSIGENAFYNCSRITKIEIPKTIKTIKTYAFYNCQVAVLDGLFIPDGMTSIEEYTFYNCDQITGELVIPESVTEIGKYAFNNCDNIESLVMPVSAKIARYAFSSGSSAGGMKKLIKVTLTGKGDMFDYSQSTTVNNVNVEWNYCWDTPWRQADASGHNLEVVIGEGITGIGENAFYNCSRITKIEIPKTIKTIKTYAFYNCQYAVLDGLFLPDGMTSVEEYTFYNCDQITGELVIPESVTEIGKYAFNNCDGIESLVMPASAQIGRYAFSSGSSAGGMKKLTKVRLTGKGNMCDYSQTSKVNNANVEWNYCWDTPWRQADTSGHNLEVVIDEGVTSVGENAFYNCSRITEITIPKAVKSIGNYAFYRCSGVEKIYYTGTETSWGKVEVGDENDVLDNVSIIYGSTKSDNKDNADKSDDNNGIALSETKKTMAVGDKFTLLLENANGTATWKSSNTSTVTVKDGVVTAVGTGTATVTATYNGTKYKCKITVSGKVGLNYSSVTIKVGETLKLKVTGAKAVTFKSSKKSVAKVKASGAVVAKKAGTTTIKVTCDNGQTYSCKVTVKK